MLFLWWPAGFYFYPRSPCGERRCALEAAVQPSVFLSTLSLRRATPAERVGNPAPGYFYPRSPCGERPGKHSDPDFGYRFLSTLSLRRATWPSLSLPRSSTDFYPRSPCGERRQRCLEVTHNVDISIHALLAESDTLGSTSWVTQRLFLSTLSLRRATSASSPRTSTKRFLSTLSLRRATRLGQRIGGSQLFLSTLSLRRATSAPMTSWLSTMNFYPRSPCGERPMPSARLAAVNKISIHALLAESDGRASGQIGKGGYFYPRSPCGERQAHPDSHIKWQKISIHALLAESDL